MSKLLKEWNRLAFSKGTTIVSESVWGGERDAGLKQLESHGFYFAGADSVVLGDLDEMSQKKFEHEYPADDPYEQGAFHVQISVENDGTYRIHDYSSVEEEFVSNWPIKTTGRGGAPFNTIEEVIAAVKQMVVGYEEFMEVYQYAVSIGAIVDDYFPALDTFHPEIQKLKKR